MPAPYPLLDMPPGDFTDMYDYQAMCGPQIPSYFSSANDLFSSCSNMAAAHNTFIQGVNAVVAHAPFVPAEKVQPFMVFCLALVRTSSTSVYSLAPTPPQVDNIHHHHDMEETFLFPALEAKLGAGALSHNVAQHAEFMPQLLELRTHLQAVQKGETAYDGVALVRMIHAFGDTMVEHLNDEIPSLGSARMREVFTEQELKDIDSAFMKKALEKIEFATTLPLSVVCGNPATPWFPPFPLPLKWATRWWFARKYSEAWEFGPLDLYGKPRVLPSGAL
ncbi:hypothetical protein C8R47DRAFT_1240208 [Mycena vitilis]|nr:hypothetical protein C8R47DRAFT_1240208 [Mycena vitilis]